MKVKTRKKIVENVIYEYEAYDGTVFETECECQEYEKNLSSNKLKGIETLVSLNNHPPFDGGEYMENSEYYWYKPKNMEELSLIESCYGLSINEENIGQWICVEVGSCGDTWFSTLKQSAEYAEHMLSGLGCYCKIVL